MKILPFDKCRVDILERTFGLRPEQTLPKFQDWISARHPIGEVHRATIERLRETLFRFRNLWNEDELKIKFIAPLLYLVQFDGKEYHSFAGRVLSAVVDGVRLTGKPDFMVATGAGEPEKPYFFLHEYKQLRVGSPDPLGQVLAAMFVAQTLNNDRQPVYGCYTVADIWRFVLLNENCYSVSQGYDVSDKTEIEIVWSILCETKKRIEQRVQEAGL
ncbi:MAG: hypothetical protein RMM53_08345 [Bacteroidia bacterium]|nr:hypothetical protein [Bacteroidia bacterium]